MVTAGFEFRVSGSEFRTWSSGLPFFTLAAGPWISLLHSSQADSLTRNSKLETWNYRLHQLQSSSLTSWLSQTCFNDRTFVGHASFQTAKLGDSGRRWSWL